MNADRPLLGILLMFGFCVLAPLGDSIAKILGESVPLAIVLLIRFALQAVLPLPLIVATRRRLKMATRLMWLMALRSALQIVGIGAMFLSLRFLPLADAVAIAFVMPFIMLILGHFVLGEEVGPRRLIACAVGFGGTLLVIQPSFAAVGLPALLPVLVAFDFALFMLVTRAIAKDVDPVSMQTVTGAVAFVALVPVVLLGNTIGWPEFELAMPDAREWALLLTLGALGTGAHLLMTWSLRFAPTSTLAPMQYLEIPVATFIGWLIFRDFPDGMALIGIAITIGSGLYIIARERRLSRLPVPASTA